MVGTGHAAYTDRFHKLARLVPHLVTPENKRIESKNGSIKMNPEKRGNRGEPSKDRNGRDDNNRTRTGNAYAATLFDSGADYSFVSATFIPLLGIEPSNLGFSYEIEIASGQLVEINKGEIMGPGRGINAWEPLPGLASKPNYIPLPPSSVVLKA
ncbi:hypothetical protein Tco_1312860 [Tanacetum coccineum]